VLYRRERRAKTLPAAPRTSLARASFGLALGLLAVSAWIILLGVDERPTPEQRGIGVVVRPGDGRRAWDKPNPGRGMAVSMAIRTGSCGDPVRVTVVASGTAEFWADNAKMLAKEGATIRIAIPDLDVRDVDVALGTDAKLAAAVPLSAQPDPKAGSIVRLPSKPRESVTVVVARIPHWGRKLRPVLVSFTADWLERRSYLGSCYLRLPALTGFPTVLSARETLGQVAEDTKDLQDLSIFTIASVETGLKAYYQANYETTRGVTSLELGSKLLKSDISRPAPDVTVQGIPTWTCSSTPYQVNLLRYAQAKHKVADVVIGNAGDGALSARRLGQDVSRTTCASYAVLEEARAQTSRDIVALLIGALFSVGVGLILEGMRRRPRPAVS
jgi:hypothetical protein